MQGPSLCNRRLSFLGHYEPNADVGRKPRRLLAKVAAAYSCKSGWGGWQEGWRYAHCTLSFISIWWGGGEEGWQSMEFATLDIHVSLGLTLLIKTSQVKAKNEREL